MTSRVLGPNQEAFNDSLPQVMTAPPHFASGIVQYMHNRDRKVGGDDAYTEHTETTRDVEQSPRLKGN